MIQRRLSTLRMSLLAALGAHVVWSCGGNTADDDASGGSSNGGALGLGGAARGGTGQGGSFVRGGTLGADGGRDSAGGRIESGGFSGGGGGGVSGGGTGGNPLECIRLKGFDYVYCTNGWVHRASVAKCNNTLPNYYKAAQAGAGGGAGSGGEASVDAECKSSRECTAAPWGHCDDGMGISFCDYGCESDSDCKNGEVCFCGGRADQKTVGVCMPSSCKSDADCNNGLCAGYVILDACTGLPFGSFRCQQALPSTTSDGGAACGRPFLVEGVARCAPLACGDGYRWSELPFGSLPPSMAREVLAQHWADMGLLEHASVAAFARFTLELMSLGAPASLLEAAQAALGDEIRHARLCFELASRYAGRSLAPGALSLSGVLTCAVTRANVVKTAFLEACIGETLAAAEAEAALLTTRDPAVRAVLEQIAGDEARHAELGFRFVKWALATATATERTALLDELEQLLNEKLAASRAVSTSGPDAGTVWSDHGMLSEPVRRELQREALLSVVLPCCQALGLARGAFAA